MKLFRTVAILFMLFGAVFAHSNYEVYQADKEFLENCEPVIGTVSELGMPTSKGTIHVFISYLDRNNESSTTTLYSKLIQGKPPYEISDSMFVHIFPKTYDPSYAKPLRSSLSDSNKYEKKVELSIILPLGLVFFGLTLMMVSFNKNIKFERKRRNS